MRDGRDELLSQSAQLLRAHRVVAVDSTGAPLELELPDQEREQEQNRPRRDDERRPCARVGHARRRSAAQRLGADQRLEASQIAVGSHALRAGRRFAVNRSDELAGDGVCVGAERWAEPVALGAVVPADGKKEPIRGGDRLLLARTEPFRRAFSCDARRKIVELRDRACELLRSKCLALDIGRVVEPEAADGYGTDGQAERRRCKRVEHPLLVVAEPGRAPTQPCTYRRPQALLLQRLRAVRANARLTRSLRTLFMLATAAAG